MIKQQSLSKRHTLAITTATLGVAVFMFILSSNRVQAPRAVEDIATTSYSEIVATSTSLGTPGYQHKTIVVRGDKILVDVSDTDELRTLGLSGRTGLAPHTGMLFAFPKDGVYKFWMKDMHFAIDIIWITNDGSIIGMAHSLPPESYPQSFAPSGVARYVLEVPAGYATERGIKVGDTVQL